MRSLSKTSDNKAFPTPLAAGQFGINPGVEVRAYRPLGCPSLEQFEAHFQLTDDEPHPRAEGKPANGGLMAKSLS